MPQCAAHSSRTGQPCRKWAISGGTVCLTHGGSAAHVRDAAKMRLLAAAIPAVRLLEKAIKRKNPDDIQAHHIMAARDILDRAGLKPKDEVEHNVQGGITVRFVKAKQDE